MTQNKLLIGSLSNDLYRVAALSHCGSLKAANKFYLSAQNWLKGLQTQENKPYIEKIIQNLQKDTFKLGDLEQAEKYLTYSIVLANYSMRIQ